MSTVLTITLCFAVTIAVLLIDAVNVARRRNATRKKLMQEPESP